MGVGKPGALWYIACPWAVSGKERDMLRHTVYFGNFSEDD
jgi:hypothetical protein